MNIVISSSVIFLPFQEELQEMVKAGVVGFKCFLINSGVSEFPYVTPQDLEKALVYLNGSGTVLAVNIKDVPWFLYIII